MRGSHRKQRVEEGIKRDLSEIFVYELKDPLLSNLTITDVEISPDKKYAKIFVSILKESEEKKEKTLKRLRKAKKFIRGRLAQKIQNIRYTPELTFKLDDSIERGFRIEEIIKKIHSEEEG